MKKRIALYPGTFDPITLGHLDVIMQAAEIFPDGLIVGVLLNFKKEPSFSVERRVQMIQTVIDHFKLDNVRVVSALGLTVELARKEGAFIIVRGLRLTTEYEDELGLAFANRKLAPEIGTILIPPRQEHIHVSSTAVRDILAAFKPEVLVEYMPSCLIADQYLREGNKTI